MTFPGSEEYSHTMFRRARGFTLVELLIVVAIISILAALLLPVLRSTMETARAVSCANRLKQIHTALVLYSNESSYWTPVISSDSGTNSKFWKHLLGEHLDLTGDRPAAELPGGWANVLKWWFDGNAGLPNTDYARRINKNVAVYDCPSQEAEKLYGDGPYNDEKWHEYGISNRVMSRKMNKLDGRQIFVPDGGETWNAYLYWSTQVRLVHNGLANFMFIDGHLEMTAEYRKNKSTNFAPWIAP